MTAPPRSSRARRAWAKLRRGLGLPLGFGAFGGTAPLSDRFGFDRGTPIDRFYIEDFLGRHAGAITGRTLEVGDDAYTARFGGDRTERRDVLHVDPHCPAATIIGDLADPSTLPEASFDCAVITQTLHLIWNMGAAVHALHRALRPGGTLLLTVPGITRVDRHEWGAGWYWSLTEHSAKRLFGEVFGEGQVEIAVYGNVFAACAFLQGAALEEVPRRKLVPVDPCFPVILGVRATR
ncbi:MAG: class I SAM-dependent methyltransferase [Sphingomonas sp.]|uniref:methyltransferase domain-containing protein n=1 Tax=Sphingomonas sp. TaxID=28214 RepID=UPI0025E0CECB|nr:methyltransferase domain-containing protein [Sphingomonas sp.]MBX9881861.1 class I SAM-dependent methyltransferase [Sphingomonas sp.]